MGNRLLIRFISSVLIPFWISGCAVSSRKTRKNVRLLEDKPVGAKELILADIRLLSPSIDNNNLTFILEYRCRQKFRQTTSYTEVTVNELGNTTLMQITGTFSLLIFAAGITTAIMGPDDEHGDTYNNYASIGAPIVAAAGALLGIHPLANFFAAIDTEKEETEKTFSYNTFDTCDGNSVSGVRYLVELQNGITFSGETQGDGSVSINLGEAEQDAPGFSIDENFGRVSILATEDKKVELPIKISEFDLRMWKHNVNERRLAASKVKDIAVVVAAFDVHDASGRFDKKVIVQLTNYLATALTKTGLYRLVPRDQLRARMLETKKGTYLMCYDESCQIELGKAVAAEKSLATTLIQVGKKCAVTANLLDLKTETSEKGAMVNTGCSPDELLDAMKQIAKQLSED